MDDIKVNMQEVAVWLSMSNGWQKQAGFIITVNDIDFSFVPFRLKNNSMYILVSELTSGAKVVEFPLGPLEFAMAATKEGTLSVFLDYAKMLKIGLDSIGKEAIFKAVDNVKNKYVKVHGEMPDIEKLDFEEDWSKANGMDM